VQITQFPIARWMQYQVRTRPALGRRVLRCIPDVKMRLQVAGLGPVRIRLRRNRSLWLRNPLATECVMFAALRRMVRPGDVVYDAGANIGIYVRYLLAQCGAGAVVAFEPMPENVELLRENVALSGLPEKVRLLEVALSDSDGTGDFQLDDISSASATLSCVSAGRASEARRQYGLPPMIARVRTACLDSILQSEKLPVPQVIKIDVEGAEGLLLSGARQLLTRHHPKLAIELHGIPCARNVVGLLSRIGYCCYGYLRKNDRFAYTGIGPEQITELSGQYDLERIFASVNPADVCQPVQPVESGSTLKPA
jgi:FkbM family methyltransferase